MTWLALISPLTVPIDLPSPAVASPTEITILAVETKTEKRLELLRDTLHGLIPSPIVVFFQKEDRVFAVSAAKKRNAPNGRPVIDGAVNHCPIGDADVDAQFFESLGGEDLRTGSVADIYRVWCERISALKSGRLTGMFRICATPEASARRDAELSEFERIFSSRAWLRKKLADEYDRTERSNIQAKIADATAALDAVKQRLQTIGEVPQSAIQRERAGVEQSSLSDFAHAIDHASNHDPDEAIRPPSADGRPQAAFGRGS